VGSFFALFSRRFHCFEWAYEMLLISRVNHCQSVVSASLLLIYVSLSFFDRLNLGSLFRKLFATRLRAVSANLTVVIVNFN